MASDLPSSAFHKFRGLIRLFLAWICGCVKRKKENDKNAVLVLEEETFDLLKRITHAARRCIMSEQYFNVTSGLENPFLVYCQNCFGEQCVLHWSTLFGSHTGEPTHFKSVFNRPDVQAVSNGVIDVDWFRSEFIRDIGMTDKEYKEFWKKAHDMRNKYIAHRDDLSGGVYFPDVEICKKQCGSLIRSTARLLETSISNGDTREDVKTLHEYLVDNGSERGVELECSHAIRQSSFLTDEN